MLKYLIALLLFVPLVSLAQNRAAKPVICFDMQSLVSMLTGEDNKETPVWRGGPNENGNLTVLFYNKETTAWSLIEYRDRTGCVLGTGHTSALSKDIESKMK